MHVNFKMYSHIYEPFSIHNVNSNHWWKSKIKLPKMIHIIAQQIGAQNINFLRWHMDLCRGWEVAIYRKLTCGIFLIVWFNTSQACLSPTSVMFAIFPINRHFSTTYKKRFNCFSAFNISPFNTTKIMTWSRLLPVVILNH
jgi:hypothetical protein